MVVILPVEGYVSVSLRSELINAVKVVIQTHREFGYKSVADFVTDAVREKLQELQAQEVPADA